MKVTTDSLLFGSWLIVDNDKHLLDVGCGSGILTLMVLQKSSPTFVTAIDIESNAIQQSIENINNCRWKDRVEIIQIDFFEFVNANKFDHIISNPPYFPSSSIGENSQGMNEARFSARQQRYFTMINFFNHAKGLLNQKGTISLMYPYSQSEACIEAASSNGLILQRQMIVQSTPLHTPYLSLLSFTRTQKDTFQSQQMIVRNDNGEYTREFKNLCKPFYLKF